MTTYNVVIEDDAGHVWEGTTTKEVEVGDIASVRLGHNNRSQSNYAYGTVIMYEESLIE